MYADKENVNILTALLVEHGIHHAVVCPGSRNAPIVHNLNETHSIKCHPVTDERSAGFYALGMAQATGEPVVVCVTSGTALLNLAPAVAEAFYQQVPLVVISADRPKRWIGQLDGQTLPQENALLTFVRKAVALPMDVGDEEERWYCNRLVNEALMEAGGRNALDPGMPKGPVHVNVPINEPLFSFTTPQLPKERVIRKHTGMQVSGYQLLAEMMEQSERLMVVVGQNEASGQLSQLVRKPGGLLGGRAVVLAESLACLPTGPVPMEEALSLIGDDEQYWPDTIVYFGGTLVSKRMKRFLRKVSASALVCMVNPDGVVMDVTMHLDHLFTGNLEGFLHHLYSSDHSDNSDYSEHSDSSDSPLAKSPAFPHLWEDVFQKVSAVAEDYHPAFSQMAVVEYFEQQLEDMEYDFDVHYANSAAVRLANIHAWHPVWCNRGVNGIEGSLSTAAGFSVASNNKVFCVIGDLSFFYDQNALWNQNLRGNLRIILLNNGKGGIFLSLPGLEQSGVRDKFVAAEHHVTARGICEQNDVGYLKASNMEEAKMGIVALLVEERQRPLLLEVFTDADADSKALADYFNLFERKRT